MPVAARMVSEGRRYQGEDEQIAYTVTTTNWGSDPSSVTVKAYDESNAMTDVTSTVLSGDASATDDVITCPVLKSLTAGHRYRVEVKFTCSGNVFECYFVVEGEK